MHLFLHRPPRLRCLCLLRHLPLHLQRLLPLAVACLRALFRPLMARQMLPPVSWCCARGASWVQVRDANGALALQRNLAAGESVSVSAPTPLAVIVGRADATEVIVRGKPFDLTAVARENVARFEVK